MRDPRRKLVMPFLVFVIFAVTLPSCVRKVRPSGDYGTKVNSVGTKVSLDTSRTVWKIPFAETFELDKKNLFHLVVGDFKRRIDSLNEKLDAVGVVESPKVEQVAETFSRSATLLSAVEKMLLTARTEKSLGQRFDDALDPQYEERYGKVPELSSIPSYLIPQAFLALVDMRAADAVLLGGAGSFTLVWAFQPYVTVTIDNKTGKITDQRFEVDSELFVFPGHELLCGIREGATPKVAVGAIFGPLKHPGDLAGASLRIGLNGTVPIMENRAGRLGMVLKNPPLFYAAGSFEAETSGTGAGTGAEVTCAGGTDLMLPVDEFLRRYFPDR